MPNKMTQPNWINGYTYDELDNVYTEIENYFTETVLSQVLQKYDNLLDLNT